MFFLGFVLALVAYYYLARYTVKAVAKRYPGKLARYFTITVFVFIPIWDVVPGHFYFRYLCAEEGGVKVYRTAEVNKEYFLANGQPDQQKLDKFYDRSRKIDREFSPFFHITKAQLILSDRQTGQQLGIATDFWYYGGWVNAMIFPQGASSTCPEYPNHTVSSSLWRQAIRMNANPIAGGK